MEGNRGSAALTLILLCLPPYQVYGKYRWESPIAIALIASSATILSSQHPPSSLAKLEDQDIFGIGLTLTQFHWFPWLRSLAFVIIFAVRQSATLLSLT